MEDINNSTDHSSAFSLRYILLSFGLSFAGMAIVFYYTYSPGLLEQMQLKRLPGLFIALLVSFFRVWFSAAKFRFLTDKELSWMAAFRIVLVWDFTSAVSPSTVGGAPMGLYAMSKENINLGKATAITLYGVLLDQIWFTIAIPFLVIAGFFYDIIPDNAGLVGESIMILIYVLLLSYAGLLAYSVLRNPTLLKKAVNKLFKLPILNRYKAKVSKEAEELERSSYELREKSKSFIFYAFFLSTMSWIARISLPVIVVLSFGQSDILLSFLRSFALNLAGFFIPTPGGSGGFEGLFAMFFAPIMPRVGYLALAIFSWRLISYYISIGLGAWSAMWYINQKVEDFKL